MLRIFEDKYNSYKDLSKGDLDYNTFDGNQIIMINTKQKSGGLGKSYVTNLEEGEAEFIASVEEQLKNEKS